MKREKKGGERKFVGIGRVQYGVVRGRSKEARGVREMKTISRGQC
jgi:hypothetical protein